MADYDENWVRDSISHFPSQKISNIFCLHKYKEDLLRELWDDFILNSHYWMRDYKFSLDFLREMKDKMNKEFWYEIIVLSDVYENKEKEKLVKEFGLPFYYEPYENEWFEIVWRSNYCG